MTTLIDRETLRARLAANPRLTLLEALPEKYYAAGHLPGARHLPHERVAELAPAVVPQRDAEIVVYCANSACQNSHIAAQLLIRSGYSNVSVYAAGKQDWVDAGLPTETVAQVATA
jgi:rhodanese-related sulfurtransferase